MEPDIAQSICTAVKDLARKVAPDVSFQEKYGGEVMIPDAENPKTIVGGIFVYKDYVSVEFSNGAGFDDPASHLEGKGKARRHIKLRTLDEISSLSVEGFLRQAFA